MKCKVHGAHITAKDLELADTSCTDEPINLRQIRDDAESKALARVDGTITKAAELHGVSRPTLYDLMNHHGIK
jgi:two-component system, NtrC family, response regulator